MAVLFRRHAHTDCCSVRVAAQVGGFVMPAKTFVVQRTRNAGRTHDTLSTHDSLKDANRALVRAEKTMRPLGYSLRVTVKS